MDQPASEHGTAVATREHESTGFVTSNDGTSIGYRRFGHGPGMVLLHGAMSSAHNHRELAEIMADGFTVYVPDRRGRGLSGPYGEADGILTEVDDLDALLRTTGAHNVFGVSVGGLICLQAALALPAIHKVAVYEPPLFPDSAAPTALLARFDKEMARGKVAAALTTAMKGTRLGPPLFNAMPRWLLEFMTKRMMAWEDKKGSGEYVPFRELAPTLHHDAQVIVDVGGRQERFEAIRADVLLLGGSKSSAFLKSALDAVAKVVPNAKRVEIPGLDHAASWNTDRGGTPAPVADELRRFFAETGDQR